MIKTKRKPTNAQDAIEATSLQLKNTYSPPKDHPDSDLSDNEQNIFNHVIVVYLTSSCVNWAFFGMSGPV
jgi:hypothetical protein